jgi:F-type H+-transporting ATPase subunit b
MTRVRHATLFLYALLVAGLPAAFAAQTSEHGPVEAHEAAVDAAHGAAADVAHGGEKMGLPQFDPSSFPSQVFWLAIAFAVLYFFFSRKTLPEISQVIENRHEHIQSNIDAADKLRREAENVHKSYEEALDNARQDAAKFYADAEDAVTAVTTTKLAAFREKSQKQIEETESKLAKSKAEVMEDMNGIAAEIASKAAEKIVGIPADLNEAKNVVRSLHNKTQKKAA